MQLFKTTFSTFLVLIIVIAFMYIEHRIEKVERITQQLDRATKVFEQVVINVQSKVKKAKKIQHPRISISFNNNKRLPYIIDNATIYEEGDWIVLTNNDGECRYPKSSVKKIDMWDEIR